MYSPYGQYGTLPIFPAKQLPTKQPLTFSRYTIDLDQIRVVPGDCSPFTAAQLTVQPSGDGEMFAAFLSVDGSKATFWLASGVRGRNYDISILAATEDNQALQGVWGILCDPLLAPYPLPVIPNPGPGSPITWSTGNPPMFGPIMNLPPITVVATGTTQLTAAPTSLAQILVNAASASGAGISLPKAATFCGSTVPVFNRSGVPIAVYPYAGDTIESNEVNASVTLQNDQTGHFTVTNSGLLIFS